MTTLVLRPSPWERPAVAGLHALALLAIALSAAPPAALALLLAALAWSAAWHWRSYTGLAGVWALDLAPDYCRVHRAGTSHRAAPPRGVFVSAWLMVLRIEFGEGGRPLLLMLWPGCLSRRDDWRLRRYLRAYPHTQ